VKMCIECGGYGQVNWWRQTSWLCGVCIRRCQDPISGAYVSLGVSYSDIPKSGQNPYVS